MRSHLLIGAASSGSGKTTFTLGLLRAGAALVIAGLAAEGITIVDDIVYIQRGYERFEEKLRSLGGIIEKVSSEKEIQKFRLKVG